MEIQASHGNSGEPWKFRRAMEIQASHGNSGEPWKFRRAMEIQASHGNSGEPWKFRRAMEIQDAQGRPINLFFKVVLLIVHKAELFDKAENILVLFLWTFTLAEVISFYFTVLVRHKSWFRLVHTTSQVDDLPSPFTSN